MQTESEEPRNPEEETQSPDPAEWAAKLTARMREDAEDVLAEAQALRKAEHAPLRKGLLYGLAGIMNAGERIRAAARGAAAGARAAKATQDEHSAGGQAKRELEQE